MQKCKTLYLSLLEQSVLNIHIENKTNIVDKSVSVPSYHPTILSSYHPIINT